VADNAGFALAPRGTTLAIDARGVSDFLEGERGMILRPVIESFAGADALATLNKLAKRSNAPGEQVAQEVFAGRIAFCIPEDGGSWLLGFESDEGRCERLLGMFRAKMTSPGRYDSASERLAMRRLGGWLLVAPLTDAGRGALDAAGTRALAEDAEKSLIGDPLMQRLLVSEAPMRIFLRHTAPSTGATTLEVRGEKRGFRVSMSGTYDSPPIGIAGGLHKLDAHLVRSFEDRAVLMMANPADGVPSVSDAFWVALLPELVPPPAMRTNLMGERVFVVGMSESLKAPAIACAWRIEDAEQAASDQDHFMRTVCCGLTRAIEAGKPQKPGAATVSETTRDVDPSAARVCGDLGPFADRFLGATFKLGSAVLCWRTVTTPCGGWQVYSSEPRWLSEVADRLEKNSCSADERPPAAGIGFCDGPRAAALLRGWQPLVTNNGDQRLVRGLAALSDTLEKLGRVRFRYDMPTARRIEAQFDIEPLGQLQQQPSRTLNASQGSRK
jgi:hypothetical protein